MQSKTMKREAKKQPLTQNCQLCSRKIPRMRRWMGARFCTKQHEEEYLGMMERLAAERLGVKVA